MSFAPKDFARVPVTLSLMKRVPPHAFFEKSREVCQNWSKISCANNIHYWKWEHEKICGYICMFIFIKILPEIVLFRFPLFHNWTRFYCFLYTNACFLPALLMCNVISQILAAVYQNVFKLLNPVLY